MSQPAIVIVSAGAMGAGVARRLTAVGLTTILTTLSGRSPATHQRARDAGMQDVSLAEIVRLGRVPPVRWVLSIVPPSKAEAFAGAFRDAWVAGRGTPEGSSEARDEGRRLDEVTFVDCNAVNPDTVRRIAALFTETSISFIDASIIGGPPTPPQTSTNASTDSDEWYLPMFYACAAKEAREAGSLDAFVQFGKSWGLNVTPLGGTEEGRGVEERGIGDASALKMAYAGISKGITGLCTAMILGRPQCSSNTIPIDSVLSLTSLRRAAAHDSSPATARALMHELASSQPGILKRITNSIPNMLPKAYRFVGEMEEISAFVEGSSHSSNSLGESGIVDHGAGKIHEGLARLYERVAGSVKDEDGGADVRVLEQFVEDAKVVLTAPAAGERLLKL